MKQDSSDMYTSLHVDISNIKKILTCKFSVGELYSLLYMAYSYNKSMMQKKFVNGSLSKKEVEDWDMILKIIAKLSSILIGDKQKNAE